MREPETAAERDVVGAGWSLYSPARVKGRTTVLLADAAVDGMCRPWDYQAFVFVRDDFAGTLSPIPMDSRSDGVESRLELTGPAELAAEFARYEAADPLCCPSRLSRVTYRIERSGGHPVLVPVRIATTPIR